MDWLRNPLLIYLEPNLIISCRNVLLMGQAKSLGWLKAETFVKALDSLWTLRIELSKVCLARFYCYLLLTCCNCKPQRQKLINTLQKNCFIVRCPLPPDLGLVAPSVKTALSNLVLVTSCSRNPWSGRIQSQVHFRWRWSMLLHVSEKEGELDTCL